MSAWIAIRTIIQEREIVESYLGSRNMCVSKKVLIKFLGLKFSGLLVQLKPKNKYQSSFENLNILTFVQTLYDFPFLS